MKLLRKMTAFILAFCLTAGASAITSAAAHDEDSSVSVEDETIAPAIPPEFESDAGYDDTGTELAATAAQSYTPRLTAPAKSNKYYYSDLNIFYKYGWGMPNCTAYAWGRAYEILGTEPNLSRNSAYLWYGYNKDNKIYAYGNTPKLGAIACWVYSSGVSGHVAVVEKIENNTITFSNSAYSTGVEFYTNTAPVNDPSNGNSTWIFQGYIYLGDYVSSGSSAAAETPADNGSQNTAGDVYRITSAEGVNLRSGYGTSYRILGGIMYGQDVTVTKVKDNEGYTWGYTTYNGVSGWFVTDFAKLIYKKTNTSTSTRSVVVPTVPPTQAPTQAPTLKPQKTNPVKATEPSTQAPTQAPTKAPKPVVIEEKEPSKPVKMMLMGDLDEDDMLTIMDATRLQMVIADLLVPTDYMLVVGDYDGDSVLSIMDASRIRFYLAYETD